MRSRPPSEHFCCLLIPLTFDLNTAYPVPESLSLKRPALSHSLQPWNFESYSLGIWGSAPNIGGFGFMVFGLGPQSDTFETKPSSPETYYKPSAHNTDTILNNPLEVSL